jgi:hypothetical protein
MNDDLRYAFIRRTKIARFKERQNNLAGRFQNILERQNRVAGRFRNVPERQIFEILTLNNTIMKKIFFLFACLLLLAAGCATQKQTTFNVACPAYYTGNDEPAASSGVVTYSGE